MAKKKYYDEVIDKFSDWGGDESTENLPVSGSRVQEFIKNEFNKKVGIFHYDEIYNRYLVFADEFARDAYLEDPEGNSNLLLGNFDAPFNYSAEIQLTTPSYVAVLSSKTDNYLTYTFDTKNKEGQSIGEDVTVTYTITRGSNKETVIERYRHGETVNFKLDDYIGIGDNRINISLAGINTLAVTSLGITYKVIDLSLTSNYQLSNSHNISDNPNINVAIPYHVSGQGVKVIEWYLNGRLIPYNKSEDEALDPSTNRTKYISLKGLSHGAHSLQFRAYTIINGEYFYSDTIYHDIIVTESQNSTPVIALSAIIPSGKTIFGENETLRFYGLQQYIPIIIKFSVYDPRTSVDTIAEFFVDESLTSSVRISNGVVQEYSYYPMGFGDMDLKIVVRDLARSSVLEIEESAINIRPAENAMILDLSAIGKTNSSVDRDQWSYGDIATEFTGFKWNRQSGWRDNKLIISNGAFINVDIRPLANNPTILGRTLEFEFSTADVIDDDAVLCSMTGTGNAKLEITASSIMLSSVGGKEVNSKFKSGENIRVAFVINPKDGVTNKELMFVYVNGIISGAAHYSADDSFTINQNLKIGGTSDASIELRHLRFYETALSSDQVLNNYIIFRDNVSEFLTLFNKNNIYEPGTERLSLDTLSSQAPIYMVTGNIPTLENTTNKKETIYVDVDYINMQDPTKSFSGVGVKMTPQGTSSMGYPKKNFRLYTNEGVMYDYAGNVIPGGMYSFVDMAIPVSLWCFKADYAESSGTHNTGVARMWNDAMKNTRLNGQFVLQTEAQQAAINSNYEYDVRTAIDGFPCHIVYRLTKDDDWIYIGKYNFNNDKATEAVFGFENIPGFDNSNVRCFEGLTNGSLLGQFRSVEDFDNKWTEAWESRYPDGLESPEHVAPLKELAIWVNSTMHNDESVYGDTITINAEIRTEKNGIYPDTPENRQLKFEMEKWDYLDVYKVAAYYIYVMRFGGVDQLIKNTFLTTESTQGKGTKLKWFFINYDNDTVLGVRNDGLLKFPPTITRQTLDTDYTSTTYAYAGHESVFWNNLEADEEFMRIVSEVDNAMFISGLTYDSVLDVFNNKQSDRWCERVYNLDSQYKYIGPFTDSNIDNLGMAQGSRKQHRIWWLRRRFDLMDSQFVSGSYRSKTIEFKVGDAPAGIDFSITAGNELYYGYGINDVTTESGILLYRGDSHTFKTKQGLNIGDPTRIYSAPNIQSVDLSGFMKYLSTLDISDVYDDTIGSSLTSLILGNKTMGDMTRNSSLDGISGLTRAIALERLNIAGYQAITSLNLSALPTLTTLEAYNSRLANLTLASGGLVSRLELPSTMQTLILDNLTELTQSNLLLQGDGINLYRIQVTSCPNLDMKNLIFNWYTTKTAPNDVCHVDIDGVNWKNVNVQNMLNLGQIKLDGGTLRLRGQVHVPKLDFDTINLFKSVYGERCFEPDNELTIMTPDVMFLSGPGNVLESTETQYEALIVTNEPNGLRQWFLIDSEGEEVKNLGPDYITDDGILHAGENEDNTTRTLTLRCVYSYDDVRVSEDYPVNIEGRTYPGAGTEILGDLEVTDPGDFYTYTLSPFPNNTNGVYNVEWIIDGDAFDSNYVMITQTTDDSITIKCNRLPDDDMYFRVIARLTRAFDDAFVHEVIVYPMVFLRPVVIISTETNPALMEICYSRGWAELETEMTNREAVKVTNSQFNSKYVNGNGDYVTAFQGNTDLESFLELPYFTKVSFIGNDLFKGCSNLEYITLPEAISSIGTSAFEGCRALKEINIPESVTSINIRAFRYCENLIEFDIPENLMTLGQGAFEGCSKIKSLIIPDTITSLGDDTFSRCESLEYIKLPSGIPRLGTNCFFGCERLESIELPTSLQSLGNHTFYYCLELKEIDIPETVQQIGSYTFYFCQSLKKITIPEGITMMGAGVFSDCISLTEINLPSSLKTINNETFRYCYALEEINIPSSVDYIGDSAFENCIRLKNITLPITLGQINNSLFYNCAELQSVSMPPAITNIGDHAFRGCLSLPSLEIPETVAQIGEGALAGCTSLSKIYARRRVAPYVSPNTFGSDALGNYIYTGHFTRDSTPPNILYVPQAAENYNNPGSAWADPLQHADKGGFVISYSL